MSPDTASSSDRPVRVLLRTAEVPADAHQLSAKALSDLSEPRTFELTQAADSLTASVQIVRLAQLSNKEKDTAMANPGRWIKISADQSDVSVTHYEPNDKTDGSDYPKMTSEKGDGDGLTFMSDGTFGITHAGIAKELPSAGSAAGRDSKIDDDMPEFDKGLMGLWGSLVSMY